MTTQAEYEARRDAVAARITDRPDRFNMRSVAVEQACGTAHCIAGWALVEAGAEFVYHESLSWRGYYLPNRAERRTNDWDVDATAYLGLYFRDARRLFFDFDLDPEDAALQLKQLPVRKRPIPGAALS